MAERQKQGFDYEANVISRFFLQKEKNYIGKWDAYCGSIPVSIKHEKYESDVELADYFRQSMIDEDFYLVCGFDNGEEHILFIPYKEWNKYFDTSMNDSFSNLLSSVTNDKSDDEKWKKEIAILKKGMA